MLEQGFEQRLCLLAAIALESPATGAAEPMPAQRRATGHGVMCDERHRQTPGRAVLPRIPSARLLRARHSHRWYPTLELRCVSEAVPGRVVRGEQANPVNAPQPYIATYIDLLVNTPCILFMVGATRPGGAPRVSPLWRCAFWPRASVAHRSLYTRGRAPFGHRDAACSADRSRFRSSPGTVHLI